MLARSRQVTLSNGIQLSTPLLIPSLSSSALEPIPTGSSSKAITTMTPSSMLHSENLVASIEESLLVSAYDIMHGLLADSGSFVESFGQSRYAQPRVLVIDSGWYEKNGRPPGSPFIDTSEGPLPWDEDNYTSTIDSLDRDMKPVVVSWDHVGSYGEQITRAQAFFADRGHLGSILLLKPSPGSRFHNLDKMSGEELKNLQVFDLIGVTEREIGESILDRLVNVSRLRKHLERAGVDSPIHVFGGLDPLMTPLYFAAGAEVFDGLGWLRYAYREGVAMHRMAGSILDREIRGRSFASQLSVPLQNLNAMNTLTDDMRRFTLRGGDWNVYARGENLRPIFENVLARLEG